MAIVNGYCTDAEFKAYKPIKSSDTSDDVVIEDIIEAASRYIDRVCNRKFYDATGTRYFDVPVGRALYVDEDLLSITTLTNGDGNTIADTEYNLEDKNNPPYYKIVLKESSAYYWEVDSDGNSEKVISVAGNWGEATAVPDDIKLACLEIVNGAYSRKSGQALNSTVKVTGAGVVITPKDISTMSAKILESHKRIF